MKLLFILIIISVVILFTAGLWLWGGLILILLWYIQTHSFPKLRAIRNIIFADRFMCCTVRRDTFEVRVHNTYPYHIRQFIDVAETIIDQNEAVESVKEIIEKYNGE